MSTEHYINQDGTSVEQSDADGRLLAAAPDLLEALRLLLAGCPDETYQTCQRLRKAEVEHLNGAIMLAKAAIAKATGSVGGQA